MKKLNFWKVVVCVAILGLFLFLWMYQWHYYDGTVGLKTSRLTGKVYGGRRSLR